MLLVHKPLGLTPLQTIHKIKSLYPDLHGEIVSYAGRLDPMAQGLLVLLIGEENKKRQSFEHMDKTYEFEFLGGIRTDTYDLLGMPISHSRLIPEANIAEKITALLPTYLGKQSQPFPPYSSKPVLGHPLYWWARAGKLDEIAIPEHDITISSLELLHETSLSATALHHSIKTRITNIIGDFRQKEILTSWEHYFRSTTSSSFPLIKLRISCSSGTYVRSIANSLGEKLGTGGLAYSIIRTQIGDFKLTDAITVDL